MSRRPVVALTVGLAAAALAACTSSSTTGSGSAATSGAQSRSSSTTSAAQSSSSASSGTSITPAALSHDLTTALSKVTTAHIALTADAAGQQITGTGDERLSNGKLKALQLSETFGSGLGKLEIVVIGGKGWIKVPTQASKTSKPWLSLTSHSSNPIVKSLAHTLDSTLSSASVSSTKSFVRAASSVKVVGHTSVNGTPATQLRLVVDTAKLPATLPGAPGLNQLGLKTLPVDLYLDAQHRPVLSSVSIKLAGQAVTTKVTISKYNQPVTITPPPPSQVAG